VTFVVMKYTVFGFAASMVGGNIRAAKIAGLPVGRLMVITCLIGGGAAGMAGMLEVAAVHGRVSSSLVVGYGYTGILIAFIARHNPLAVIPIALLLGGINASGGLVQRRHDLPDATVLVMQSIVFLMILVSEPLYGRLRWFHREGR
jgi:simple sugar transport system permease protein